MKSPISWAPSIPLIPPPPVHDPPSSDNAHRGPPPGGGRRAVPGGTGGRIGWQGRGGRHARCMAPDRPAISFLGGGRGGRRGAEVMTCSWGDVQAAGRPCQPAGGEMVLQGERAQRHAMGAPPGARLLSPPIMPPN